MVVERADCAIEAPTLAYVIPSVEDCHWMFPILPAARFKFTLFPWQVVNKGDNVPTTVIVAAFETTVSSCKVTVEEVTLPHWPPLITTLYLVPFAGSAVVVLVITNEALVAPE